jgi:hypothetical protein
MNKLGLLLFLCLLFQSQVNAQTQKATVYLFRYVDRDPYVPYYTYMDQTLLCRLGDGEYSIHEVEPGEHQFHAQYKGKIKSTPETELLINLEPGKIYYVSVNLATKAFGKGRFYCEQLSEEEGMKRTQTYYRRIKCI